MASYVKPSLLLLFFLLPLPFVGGSFLAYQLSLFLIYAIATQAVGYVWGKAGILPLGQAAFFGCSAYLFAGILKATTNPAMQILAFIIVPCLVALLAFLMAAVIFKGKQHSGPFFSLITLALAMIAEQLSNGATQITGGFNGFSGFGEFLSIDPFGNLYFLVAFILIGTTLLFMIIDALPFGLLIRAMAENEDRLRLLGVRTYLLKASAFAISAGVAALAGALFAAHQGIVTPSSIGFVLSAELVIWAAVGGRFHPLGAVIGAVFIGFLSFKIRGTVESWEIIIALIFIFVVLKLQGGLWGGISRFLPWLQAENKPAYQAPDAEIMFAKDNQILQSDNVCLQIGSVKILNDLQIEFPAAGIVSIIGPNGAGKTSILNVITGNLPINSGAINLGDVAIDSRPVEAALISGIGRKIQIPSLFMNLSIAENLLIGTLAARARIKDLLSLKTLAWQSKEIKLLKQQQSYQFMQKDAEIVCNLAQGHRQFLEFAMTIASTPRILLLDEPCAGLSPEEGSKMSQLIVDYQKRHQALVIMIEHDMNIVKAISDKVFVVSNGRLLASGSYKQVSENPKVKEIYAGAGKS